MPDAEDPLGAAHAAALAGGAGVDLRSARDEAIARYGFAIASDEALDRIAAVSPAGVVEVGAGTGYWARRLALRGVDVVAFDAEPAPSPANPWFAGSRPWHPVQRGDAAIVDRHAERTLLLVWPTRNEVWAADAVERYHRAGGACVAYVGEGPGGRTGDDVFHARLGEEQACAHCLYGVTTSPCIAGVEPLWRRTETVTLPHWPGYADDLHLYTRRDAAPRSRPVRWRRLVAGRRRR